MDKRRCEVDVKDGGKQDEMKDETNNHQVDIHHGEYIFEIKTEQGRISVDIHCFNYQFSIDHYMCCKCALIQIILNRHFVFFHIHNN